MTQGGTAPRQEDKEKTKYLSRPVGTTGRFLCGVIDLMFLHGSKDPQFSLKPFVVVIINVCPDHLNKSFPAGKFSAVVALPFQYSPKSFHRAVINTLGNSRHALGDTCLRQFSVKCPACVLKSPITVEEWTSASILPYGSVQCREDEFVGVSVSDLICYDASVVEVNNGTEIDFVYDDVVFFRSVHLNSVTSVSHFWLGASA